MASIQARDRRAAERHLGAILALISQESTHRFSYYKLRTLQVLTNANRAAFNAGASADQLAIHSLEIVRQIDCVISAKHLVRLARTAVRTTIRLVPTANIYRERIVQEAIHYIHDHFGEAITRELLAVHLRCSPAHFSRVFSQTTGYTYRDFLIQFRVAKAKELLRFSHLQVAEIAGMVGYEDPFQFSKQFRKRVGVSPRQYRISRIA